MTPIFNRGHVFFVLGLSFSHLIHFWQQELKHQLILETNKALIATKAVRALFMKKINGNTWSPDQRQP